MIFGMIFGMKEVLYWGKHIVFAIGEHNRLVNTFLTLEN